MKILSDHLICEYHVNNKKQPFYPHLINNPATLLTGSYFKLLSKLLIFIQLFHIQAY